MINDTTQTPLSVLSFVAFSFSGAPPRTPGYFREPQPKNMRGGESRQRETGYRDIGSHLIRYTTIAPKHNQTSPVDGQK